MTYIYDINSKCMCLQLFHEDLNLSPYSLHPTNTYTCEIDHYAKSTQW